ncbi:MAG: hypothetical protein IJX44_04115 [Bacteroidaceae bacterium]|nr:hypothetical protein [Bacteroidaceae bacterium]
MKHSLILFSLLALFAINELKAQNYLETNRITDWNNLTESGFYESSSENGINIPNSGRWYWGVNIAYVNNSENNKENGQLLIEQSLGDPAMYFRCTSKSGSGVWNKVICDKGNQVIDGNLTVTQGIEASEILVTIDAGADYVFDPSYRLSPLDDVEIYVKEHKHLPEIPSEAEMKSNGLNVNDFQIKLLKKIEEQTLYIIDLHKQIETLNARISTLENRH